MMLAEIHLLNIVSNFVYKKAILYYRKMKLRVLTNVPKRLKRASGVTIYSRATEQNRVEDRIESVSERTNIVHVDNTSEWEQEKKKNGEKSVK